MNTSEANSSACSEGSPRQGPFAPATQAFGTAGGGAVATFFGAPALNIHEVELKAYCALQLASGRLASP